MNGTHLMVIGLAAATVLDLHAGAGSLLLVMASAARLLARGSRDTRI